MMNRRSNVVAFPIDMEDYACTHAEAEPSFVLMLNVGYSDALRYCRQRGWQTEHNGETFCLLIADAE